MPSIGTLQTYAPPKGTGRVDDGFEEGMEIPIYYDPMIAKLVTYGADRTEAINRMLRAIEEYQIDGCATTLPFGTYVLQHEAFVSGNFDTNFVKAHYDASALNKADAFEAQLAAQLAVQLLDQNKGKGTQTVQSESNNKNAGAWKSRAWK